MMRAAPVHENAVAVSGGWGMVVATPGNENRPKNNAHCPLPTIFTIKDFDGALTDFPEEPQ